MKVILFFDDWQLDGQEESIYSPLSGSLSSTCSLHGVTAIQSRFCIDSEIASEIRHAWREHRRYMITMRIEEI